MSNDLSQQFRTTLDGKSAAFRFRWNELDEFWYVSLDVDGVRVSTGRRVTANSDLFFAQAALPGMVMARPLISNDETDPGLGGWDVTHELVYIEV